MIYALFSSLLRDLGRQPLRTFLTLSGVIWGTFAIVLLLAFGEGFAQNMQKTAHGLGESILICWPGKTTKPYRGFTKGRAIRITPEHVLGIKDKVALAGRVSPELMRTYDIRYKDEFRRNTVRGINVEYGVMRNVIPARGRFINSHDLELFRRVCFLGYRLKDNLFKKEDAVGKNIMIKGKLFKVVGVLKEKEQDSNYSGNRDKDSVFIPWTTYRAVFGTKYVNNFIVQTKDPQKSSLLVEQVRKYLGSTAGFDYKDEDAMGIWDYTEMERSMSAFTLAFKVFLGMIGAFTLLVGGIGVASIMMVSVEERVREIGIKIAVGAKRVEILKQFFFEALFIVLTGGLVGLSLAEILLGIIPFEQFGDFTGIPVINFQVAVATITVLMIVGGVAGYAPAKRASSTDPVIALRS